MARNVSAVVGAGLVSGAALRYLKPNILANALYTPPTCMSMSNFPKLSTTGEESDTLYLVVDSQTKAAISARIVSHINTFYKCAIDGFRWYVDYFFFICDASVPATLTVLCSSDYAACNIVAEPLGANEVKSVMTLHVPNSFRRGVASEEAMKLELTKKGRTFHLNLQKGTVSVNA